MKKVNFNSLESITTPEDWLKKALSLPEASGKKAAGRLIRYRTVTAAACLVAVASVSVMLFVLSLSRQPFVINISVSGNTDAPLIYVSETEATDANESIQSSAPTSSEKESEETESARQSDTDISDQSSRHTETVFVLITETQEISSQTEPQITETSDNTKETFAEATEDSSTAATEQATEQAYLHTESPSQTAAEPEADYIDSINRGFYVPADMDIYCKITDISGSVLYGDEDIYSEQHLCTVTQRTKYQTFCSYSPKEHGILPEKGCYICVFYDSPGAVLLTEKVYLNC